MAVDIGGTVQGIFSGAGGVMGTVLLVIGVILVVLLVLGFLFWLWWNNKRYNLVVEIKKVRSDGKFISGEIGKGLYNSNKGAMFIKRKGIRGHTTMKVFDIRRYLQGENLLTVIQVGSQDYRPVLADSWTEHVTEYEDEKTGEVTQIKEAIINIKVDSGLNKAWKSSWENAAKRAYSLQSFLNQFAVPISIAIVLVAVFVGFAILYQRMPMICGGH